MHYARRAELLVRSHGSNRDESAHSEIERLERVVAKQNLLLQTLIALLLEKNVFHEDEFKDLMEEIDELDGVKDGALKQKKAPIVCKACGKKNSSTKLKCMWCGAELEQGDLLVKLT